MQAQPTIRALAPQKNIPTTSRAIRHTFTIRILKKRTSKATIKKARKILYFFSKKGLTNQKECGIISRSQRCDDLGVAQLVARYLGVVEAASSSLVTQTKRRFFGISVFLCFWRVSLHFCVSKLLTVLQKRGSKNAVFCDCYPKLLPKLLSFTILPF